LTKFGKPIPGEVPGFRIPFRFKDIAQTINPDTGLLNKPDDKRNKKFAKVRKRRQKSGLRAETMAPAKAFNRHSRAGF
jgi:hypothetical protein